MGRSCTLYWVSAHAGAVKAAREENIDILWNGPSTESDFSGELQIVENMINQHVDDADSVWRRSTARRWRISVNRAATAGIPVFIWDLAGR